MSQKNEGLFSKTSEVPPGVLLEAEQLKDILERTMACGLEFADFEQQASKLAAEIAFELGDLMCECRDYVRTMYGAVDDPKTVSTEKHKSVVAEIASRIEYPVKKDVENFSGNPLIQGLLALVINKVNWMRVADTIRVKFFHELFDHQKC